MKRIRSSKPGGMFIAPLLVSVMATSLQAADSDEWTVVVAPYLFLTSIEGDATVGRLPETEVDVSPGEVLKNLQAVILIHAEARKKNWGVVVDYAMMKLGSDLSGPRGGVAEVDVRQVGLELLLSRRFQWGHTKLDLNAGAVYWDIDIEAALTQPFPTETLKRGDNWWDPVVGARVTHDLTPRWATTLNGEIGGFGSGSDFCWQLMGGVNYGFADWFILSMQYKAIGVDYENDRKGQRDYFHYDTITHGPLIGLVFRF
ncbi:MAG: hypothetical protein JXQ27_05545 [Acidobacteria bacterium]|nr:hypothetical protein [Acidobacteriota bacterium]